MFKIFVIVCLSVIAGCLADGAESAKSKRGLIGLGYGYGDLGHGGYGHAVPALSYPLAYSHASSYAYNTHHYPVYKAAYYPSVAKVAYPAYAPAVVAAPIVHKVALPAVSYTKLVSPYHHYY